MSAVASFVEDVVGGAVDLVEDVVDAVGDVVETVGDVVSDTVEFIGDTVQKVLDDPLPTILSVAGSFVGIPPPVTMAAVTAARGGDLQDIVLSAGAAYLAPTASSAISSTLSATIGDAIVNEAVSDAVVNSVSKGLVNGAMSEIRGGNFEDGFAGGFTGGMVTAGVGEVTNFVKPDVIETMTELGLDEKTAGQIASAGTRAIASGVTAEITGKGSFATAFTNSVINTTANAAGNVASSSIVNQFKDAQNVDQQISGAEGGNTKDQDQLKAELADAWANRDVNEVNGLLSRNQITADDARTMFDLTDEDMGNLSNAGLKFHSADSDTKTTTSITDSSTGNVVGTGAGISGTLVDEVQTSSDGTNTGDASGVVQNLNTTYLSDDLRGGDSVSTVSGSNEQSTVAPVTGGTPAVTSALGDLSTTGYKDVADIADSVGGVDQTQQSGVGALPAGFEDLAVGSGSTAPVGGLGSVSALTGQQDLLSSLPAGSNQTIGSADQIGGMDDVTGSQSLQSLDDSGTKPAETAGGLNATSDQSGSSGISNKVVGTLASGLGSLVKQGVTKSVKGNLTQTSARPPVKRVPVPISAPKKLSATQLAALTKTTPVAPSRTTASSVGALKPVTSMTTPPKKVDVSKLTPVTNIASLSALLGKKG